MKMYIATIVRATDGRCTVSIRGPRVTDGKQAYSFLGSYAAEFAAHAAIRSYAKRIEAADA